MKINRFAFLRNWIKGHPSLRSAVLPAYALALRHSWAARNLLTMNRPIEIPTSCGNIRMVAEGQIAEVLWRYDFEAPEREFFDLWLKSGMSVINVGANAGLYTLMAAKLIGDTGQVHAFEPASESFDRLAKNVLLNGLKNTYCNRCAVSSSAGTVSVFRDMAHPDFDAHFSIRSATGGEGFVESIPSITLDEYWLAHCNGSLKPVDAMIVDVEGLELEVLLGAKRLLAASPNILIMAECTAELSKIDSLLRADGFRFFVLDASSGLLTATDIKRGNMFICRDC